MFDNRQSRYIRISFAYKSAGEKKKEKNCFDHQRQLVGMDEVRKQIVKSILKKNLHLAYMTQNRKRLLSHIRVLY